ncbi:DgyrCDS11989 [Dimorphilus gyrociliatus]|uniref:DgyrCDS11989 n=1 Tax=Dimorphilus gyrociliatus TaxID=2664684 RepID=A0A7I8W547_9ANNE|nr:DgyrCDS11989 [Dimorphilus gyrociliatus]
MLRFLLFVAHSSTLLQFIEGRWTIANYVVTEETDGGSILGNIARDSGFIQDIPSQKNIEYRLLQNDFSSYFEIFPYSSDLTYLKIDREKIGCSGKRICELNFKVYANRGSSGLGLLQFKVTVKDINDHSPTWRESRREWTVHESVAPNKQFLSIPPAIDPDSPKFASPTYKLEDDHGGRYRLQYNNASNNVKIVLSKTLDREAQDSYQLRLIATDGGGRKGELQIDVRVKDANDNVPKFDHNSYSAKVPENLAINSTILIVSAQDDDVGDNSVIIYSLPSSSAQLTNVFNINKHTGRITLASSLDRETTSGYIFYVQAKDSGPYATPVETLVNITVVDINDNAPSIHTSPLLQSSDSSLTILENDQVGRSVAMVYVSDPDEGRNGRFSCTIDSNKYFTLTDFSPSSRDRHQREYEIKSNSMFNYEELKEITAVITCKDNGNPAQTSTSVLEVKIRDENDNDPIFEKELYKTEVTENKPINRFIAQVKAIDKDSGDNGKVSYSLDAASQAYFNIIADSGKIYPKGILDREEKEFHNLTVIARDKGTKPNEAKAYVEVTVKDVNDCIPTFVKHANFPVLSISENEARETHLLGSVAAEDCDIGENGKITYSIVSARDQPFSINKNTGVISTTEVLDRENTSSYHLLLEARDGGSPSLFSTISMKVHVIDRNDEKPHFTFPSAKNNTLQFSAHAPVGTAITKIQVSDKDFGNNGNVNIYFQQTILSFLKQKDSGVYTSWSCFQMNIETGNIKLVKDLSTLSNKTVTIDLEARDGGSPFQFTRTQLIIVFNDSIPWHDSHSSLLSRSNLLILIAVGIGSFVVILLLILCICCLRQSKKDKQQLRYNCRTEALKILYEKNGGPTIIRDSDKCKHSPREMKSLNYEKALDPSHIEFVYGSEEEVGNSLLHIISLPPMYAFIFHTLLLFAF